MPDSKTQALALEALEKLHASPESPLTWEKILADDPFEGDHWKNPFDQPAEDDDSDNWSQIEQEDSLQEATQSPLLASPSASEISEPASTAEDAEVLIDPIADLLEKQYWRDDWKSPLNENRALDLGDPSTLGKILPRSRPQ